MKAFKVEFTSEDNLINSRELVIKAKNISEAQDKFVSYLKSTGVWQHLWQLSFKFEECKILED